MKFYSNEALVKNPVSFTLCTSEDDFRRTIERIGGLEDRDAPWLLDGTVGTTHDWKHRMVAIVCMAMDGGESDAEFRAILAHEAVHVWQLARVILGEHAPSKEFEAYAIQNITWRLFMLMDRAKKKAAKID